MNEIEINSEIEELEKALLEGACTLDMDAYQSIKDLWLKKIGLEQNTNLKLARKIMNLEKDRPNGQEIAATERARKHWKGMYDVSQENLGRANKRCTELEKKLRNTEVRIGWFEKWKEHTDQENRELKAKLKEIDGAREKETNTQESIQYWMGQVERIKLDNSGLKSLAKEYKKSFEDACAANKELRLRIETLEAENKAIKDTVEAKKKQQQENGRIGGLRKRDKTMLDEKGMKKFWELRIYGGLTYEECCTRKYNKRTYSITTLKRACKKYTEEVFIPELLKGRGTKFMTPKEIQCAERFLKQNPDYAHRNEIDARIKAAKKESKELMERIPEILKKAA